MPSAVILHTVGTDPTERLGVFFKLNIVSRGFVTGIQVTVGLPFRIPPAAGRFPPSSPDNLNVFSFLLKKK